MSTRGHPFGINAFNGLPFLIQESLTFHGIEQVHFLAAADHLEVYERSFHFDFVTARMFRATAALIGAVKASAFATAAPGMSMARRVLPSRLALNRCAG